LPPSHRSPPSIRAESIRPYKTTESSRTDEPQTHQPNIGSMMDALPLLLLLVKILAVATKIKNLGLVKIFLETIS
jgi:hypothetical protein